jgi:hypothetical protein
MIFTGAPHISSCDLLCRPAVADVNHLRTSLIPAWLSRLFTLFTQLAPLALAIINDVAPVAPVAPANAVTSLVLLMQAPCMNCLWMYIVYCLLLVQVLCMTSTPP